GRHSWAEYPVECGQSSDAVFPVAKKCRPPRILPWWPAHIHVRETPDIQWASRPVFPLTCYLALAVFFPAPPTTLRSRFFSIVLRPMPLTIASCSALRNAPLASR